MIDKERFHVFNYVKKEEYCGSMDGMRYMLKKKTQDTETFLEAITWPEPYCFAKTEEEKKRRNIFPFSNCSPALSRAGIRVSLTIVIESVVSRSFFVAFGKQHKMGLHIFVFHNAWTERRIMIYNDIKLT